MNAFEKGTVGPRAPPLFTFLNTPRSGRSCKVISDVCVLSGETEGTNKKMGSQGPLDAAHRRSSSVNFGAKTFLSENICRPLCKINKMPQFYKIFARKK